MSWQILWQLFVVNCHFCSPVQVCPENAHMRISWLSISWLADQQHFSILSEVGLLNLGRARWSCMLPKPVRNSPYGIHRDFTAALSERERDWGKRVARVWISSVFHKSGKSFYRLGASSLCSETLSWRSWNWCTDWIWNIFLSLSCPGLVCQRIFPAWQLPYRGSWTSTIRLVCPELSDDKQKRHRKKAREKETAQKREGKERNSFAGFPSKALPHCSRFLSHFA